VIIIAQCMLVSSTIVKAEVRIPLAVAISVKMEYLLNSPIQTVLQFL
jgi:hypothetical protein